MIKAIFFDIDGTLLSHHTKQVPTSTKKALKILRDKGIYTFISTGRHISEIKDLPLDDLHFDGYITLNGQYCFNNKEVIYHLPINHQDIKNIIMIIDNIPFPCIFVENDIMYINYINDVVKEVQESISTPLPDINDLHRGLDHPIYQVIPYDIDNEIENRLSSIMPHCKFTKWHNKAIDIIPSSGGKQNGIKKILDYYNINIKDTMAFGDGLNDISMFEYCNISVAMENASNEVKNKAKYVTSSVDDDGIYNALKYYKII